MVTHRVLNVPGPLTNDRGGRTALGVTWADAEWFADRVLDDFAPVEPVGSVSYLACRDVLRILGYLGYLRIPSTGLRSNTVLDRALDPGAHERASEELTQLGHLPEPHPDDPVAVAWTWLQNHEQHDSSNEHLPAIRDPESHYERGLRTAVELLHRDMLYRRGGWPIGTAIRVIAGEHGGELAGVLSPIWANLELADHRWNAHTAPPAAYRVWLLDAGI